MGTFYSIFNIISVIILAGLLVWSGYVLKPKDFDIDNKKAHSKS